MDAVSAAECAGDASKSLILSPSIEHQQHIFLRIGSYAIDVMEN